MNRAIGGGISLSTPIRPPHISQRRSQLILLSVGVVVSGERANGSPFSERTTTLIVNAHGALIRLRQAVLAGQRLRIKNLMTNEERPCVVADINPGQSASPEMGVAFSESCPEFWRVSFPPEDWSPHSPEARRPGGSKLGVKLNPDLVGTKR
jgi:hypothetical protein